MKTKFTMILTLFMALIVQTTFAQEKTVSGTVSDENGLPLIGATVVISGTSSGTTTDFDGKFIISSSTGDVLKVSYIGYSDQLVTANNSKNITVVMQADDSELDEVVVTALGISRDKKSIGYASQQVSGDAVSTVKVDNIASSLSGKVSGVQIKTNNNFGGSANILIRGVSSLTGNNQPLFVVDGIPISNNLNNSAQQRGGRKGYDYGNAAMDINADDVDSINILKGAAASAIYGSRGANGVVIITTKKGGKGNAKVTVTSSAQIGTIDKSTFINYQDEYGAGYGAYYGSTGYFEDWDMTGDGVDNLVVPTYDDASFGAPLNGQLVYQWDAFVPEHPNFGVATPYIAGKNTPVDFFETSSQLNNSISITGGDDKTSYRLGYTNSEITGYMPNSKLNKNSLNFSGTLKVNDKLTVGSSANYLVQKNYR